jgi:peptidoglycan-N-acetylmuramic acid deacetylase
MVKYIVSAVTLCAVLCSCSTAGQSVPRDEVSRSTAELTSPSPVPSRAPISFAELDATDNKSSGWGFKKNKGAEPDIYDSTKALFAKYDTYYMDSSKPKALYLTFDEGYENGYTASILDTLKKCGVPAAFFITGPYAKTETELVQRMIDEGHTLGNHTVNHPNLPKLSSSEKMIKELDDLNSIVTEKYGVEMKYMRPPEGEWSERLLAAAQSAGYKTILWSFAYRDWDTKTQKGADYAFEQVTPYLHNGAILLLHAVSSDNAAALERIIEYAKSEGYEFRSLDELHPNN